MFGLQIDAQVDVYTHIDVEHAGWVACNEFAWALPKFCIEVQAPSHGHPELCFACNSVGDSEGGGNRSDVACVVGCGRPVIQSKFGLGFSWPVTLHDGCS